MTEGSPPIPTLRGARCVVTGAAGFIGQHLVRALAASGAGSIVAVDLRPIPADGSLAPPEVLVAASGRSILDPLDDLLQGTDVVFHLAAHVSPPRSVADPLRDCLANVIGTLALLESCRRTGIKRLVYSSSAAVYGEPEYLPVDESHPTRPRSPYGLSKLTGERYCLLYGELHGLSAISLRYQSVYGPGQPLAGGYAGVIRIFLDRVERGLPLPVEGDGAQRRDFVHVRDVARANLLAATSSYQGVVNVASGTATSVLDLARLIGGPDHPIERRPPRRGDIRDNLADPRRAREVLGFATAISLEQGLAELKRGGR